MSRNPLPTLFLLLSTFFACQPAAEPEILEFDPSTHPDSSPVRVAVPTALADVQAFTLTDATTGNQLPVQRDGEELVFLPDQRLAARYELKAAAQPHPKMLRLTQDAEKIEIFLGNRPVLRYNIAVVEPPEGIAAHYRRSGYIHPLYSPEGAVLTGDLAPDHAHQHGIFFAWVNTTFRGEKVDFWNQADETGRVEHVAVLDTVSGPAFARFRVQLRHSDIRQPEQPVAVLDEEWTVTVYAQDEPFLLDLTSRQVCVADSPLHLNQYHYGGMAFRGSNDWVLPHEETAPDSVLTIGPGQQQTLTSEGKGRIEGNHSRPQWVDMSGVVLGKTGGVALLQHPGDFRFPQFTRIHPSMPYFCFPPVVEQAYDLLPGQPYTSSYRIVSHSGRPEATELDRLWEAYAQPAAAK